MASATKCLVFAAAVALGWWAQGASRPVPQSLRSNAFEAEQFRTDALDHHEQRVRIDDLKWL